MAPRPGMSGILASMMSQRDDDTPATHPIDPRAQAMELRDRFRRAMVSTQFEPGMLCIEKRGMALLRSPQLVVFWRWLEPTDVQDAAMIADSVEKSLVHRTDCIVGLLDHDGDLKVVSFESWRLQRCDAYPEDAA
jgi:hypothetical protein